MARLGVAPLRRLSACEAEHADPAKLSARIRKGGRFRPLDYSEFAAPGTSIRQLHEHNNGYPQTIIELEGSIEPSVAEAVEGLTTPPYGVVSPVLPGGHAATGHLALSDATGDSAIFEYLDGELVVHHGGDFTVMTNDPTYDQQLALCFYWDEVGGNAMLPGTERPADRFVRARYYLNGTTVTGDAALGLAEVFAIVRNVSVPMIQSTPDKPNVAPTLWRTAIDHRSLTYYWEGTNQPNLFWTELANLDLSPGAPTRRLEAEDGPTRAGEVSDDFVEAEPFLYLAEVS